MFNLGDVVKLKSGGVPMTVHFITEWKERPLTVTCVWLDRIGNCHREWFELHLLEKVE